MAHMHVLDGDGRVYRVVMHFAVPNAVNPVGVNWRTALVNSGFGGTTVLVEGTGEGQILATEKAQIAAGEVYEALDSYPVESGGDTLAQLLATLQTRYAALETAAIERLQVQLRYYGHEASKS